MTEKIKVGIIGPGNIGTDLMYKILKRSHKMQLELVSGIVPTSEGLKRAKKEGIKTSSEGIEGILGEKDIRIVFDSTSAKQHLIHAPLLEKAGKIAIDLTPAAVGPYIIPVININQCFDRKNVNMITCGGQATIPIVYAISRVVQPEYAEVVVTLSTLSAGPGTRQNIDEFTETTAYGVEKIGGAKRGKAIILINQADPPITMNCTIYAEIEPMLLGGKEKQITQSVHSICEELSNNYVPGYELKVPPLFEDGLVTVMIMVQGAGDYLPTYSGNLDIMNSAATEVGEKLAEHLLACSA